MQRNLKKDRDRRIGRLVLERAHNEQILIGADIRITVLLSPGKVEIAVEAPKSIDILRGELVQGGN